MRTTASTAPPAAPADGAAVRTRPAMAVIAVALITVMSAVSGLNLALPALARATAASQTS